MKLTVLQKLIFKSFLGIFSLLIYCEYLIYYIILYNCKWPEIEHTTQHTTLSQQTVKALIIADTHLLGSRRGHWFDKLRREWQMSRTFKTAMILHKPELVFVLGDLFDEGLICGKEEFEQYVQRFQYLFPISNGTEMYVAIGNHDVGFHHEISPYLIGRFTKAFNTSGIQLVTLKGNHFVLVNSMALEGDGCFLCRPAEAELTRIERMLNCAQNPNYSYCTHLPQLSSNSKPILLQHYPLYRDSDKDCTDVDSAPLPERHKVFKENWDCLSKGATHQLLRQLKPRLVLSGHTHHGCTRQLPYGDGVEISIPSFSWRNKNNPSYGMAVFTPDTYAFSKCAMPQESTVINFYAFGISVILIWLTYSYFSSNSGRRKQKSN